MLMILTMKASQRNSTVTHGDPYCPVILNNYNFTFINQPQPRVQFHCQDQLLYRSQGAVDCNVGPSYYNYWSRGRRIS